MQQDRGEKALQAKILAAEQDRRVDSDALWNKLEPMIGKKEKAIAPIIYRVAAAIILVTGIAAVMQLIYLKKNETGIAQISTYHVAVPPVPTQETALPQPTEEKKISMRVTRSVKHYSTTNELPPEALPTEDETYTQDPSTFGLYANADNGEEDPKNEELITN